MGRNREERREEGESRAPPAYRWWQGCHRNCAEDVRTERRGQAGSPGPWEQMNGSLWGKQRSCPPVWHNLQPVRIKRNFLRGSSGVASSCLASLLSLSVLFGCPWVLGCGRWFRATGACPDWGRGHWQALWGPLPTLHHGCICLFLHRGRGCTNYARL